MLEHVPLGKTNMLLSSSLVCITYLFVHLRIVEHGNELFHEGLPRDLLVERCATLVHQDVKEAEREEDHSQLRHLQSAQQVFRHYLGTMTTQPVSMNKCGETRNFKVLTYF